MQTNLRKLLTTIFSAFVMLPLASAFASVEISQKGLSYETCGTGPAHVVFLHDGFLHSATFDEVWTQVCKAEGISALRYDRRGYGRTPASTIEYSDMNDLTLLLRELGIQRATFVASSAATHIAADFAIRQSGQVAGLILAAPAIGPYRYSKEYVERRRTLLSPLKDGDILEVITRISKAPYFVSESNPKALDRMIVLLAAHPQNVAPRSFSVMPTFIYDRLNEITAPTLILVGKHDDPENLRHAKDVQSSIPNAKMATFANAAHLMHLEDPEIFARYVIDFVVD